nr:immunoglobulin heavy chain junction region [Macaca mulatta]
CARGSTVAATSPEVPRFDVW